MSNLYIASRSELRTLFSDSRKRVTRENYERLLNEFTKEELKEQLARGEGKLIDSINEMATSSGSDNANIEIVTALSLADFYYPNTEVNIAFEISDKVAPETVTTYEELISSFETNTHVDCRIIADEKTINFQIKRYPYPHREFSPTAIVKWLQEDVIRYYGDMSGTNLCILLQPSGDYREGVLDVDEIVKGIEVMDDIISFDEVMFTFNEVMLNMVLLKVYPEKKRILIPLEWALARLRGDIAPNL